MWAVLRERLERTGHAIRGTVVIELDDDGADRLGGLLGRSLERGTCRVRLLDLDAALRTSAAGRGLVAVVSELTGAALRDRPAERVESQAGREKLWAHLDSLLVGAGLADQDWVTPWMDWLHRGGVLTRLPASAAEPTPSIAVRVVAAVLAADRAPRSLAELAIEQHRYGARPRRRDARRSARSARPGLRDAGAPSCVRRRTPRAVEPCRNQH